MIGRIYPVENVAETGKVTANVYRTPLIPAVDTGAISVESAYYWLNPAAGLKEIRRVLRPGTSAWILINYYRDNLYCHQWGALLAVPTHLLSADEWSDLFRDAGFAQITHERVPDPSPSPEVYTGRWFRDAAELRAFKAEGALLLHAVASH